MPEFHLNGKIIVLAILLVLILTSTVVFINLPVVVFAGILAFAANRVSKAFNALTFIERWMRRVTAVVFILVGAYYCLAYVFGVI